MDLQPGPSTSEEVTEPIYSKITTEFSHDVIKEILKLNDKESKPKITEEAVELVKEITKALVVESAMRAARQASLENKSTVTLENVETMLLQLMLDFP